MKLAPETDEQASRPAVTTQIANLLQLAAVLARTKAENLAQESAVWRDLSDGFRAINLSESRSRQTPAPASASGTPGPTLLKPHEAAAILSVATMTLAKWRVSGAGPSYVKVGRSIRYRPDALTKYAEGREQTSTSSARPRGD